MLRGEMSDHPVPGVGINEVLPAIRAAIALHRGEPSRAIQELQRAALPS